MMNKKNNRVILLSRRWEHHAAPSGYDILCNYIGQALTAKPIPTALLPDRYFWNFTRGVPGYDRTSLALEMRAARHMAFHSGLLYHILYGDNSYHYLGKLNGWRRHRVMATFHLPARRLAQDVQKVELFGLLSAIVVVGRNQFPSFTDYLPKERIFFVPYAVDTSFFIPPADHNVREHYLCLFVGSHLRDFNTLRQLIENARILAPQLKFVVVLHPLHIHLLDGVVGNYIVLSNVSDSKLLSLYQQASLLIQPLHDSTTNTSLLEAISCGLPVVVSEVGGVRDYLNDEIASFVPPYDASSMLEAILTLIENPLKRRQMAEMARENALSFDWSVTATQMRKVYEEVLSSS
jgi:glycosyltransferase involved in cell wall biosynthesis